MREQGALEPTLVTLGWPKNWRTQTVWAEEYVNLLKTIRTCGKGILLLKGETGSTKAFHREFLTLRRMKWCVGRWKQLAL